MTPPNDLKDNPYLDRYLEWSHVARKKRLPLKWFANIQGQRLTIKYKSGKEPHRRGGLRQQIGGFSHQARWRMLKFIAEIDWKSIGPSLFVTLTYPDEVAHNDKDKRNQERYLFLRYVENYLCTRICGLWRVEYKPRLSGARAGELLSHMHMFIFGVKYIDADNLRLWWQRSIGSTAVPMVNVEKAKDGLRAVKYIAKYCGKLADPAVNLDRVTYLNNGRHYGYHRKRHISRCLDLEFPLLDEALIHRIRILAGKQMAYLDLDYFETFTLVGEFAVKLGEMIVAETFDNEANMG